MGAGAVPGTSGSTGHQAGGRAKPLLCPIPRKAVGLGKLGTQCSFQAGT